VPVSEVAQVYNDDLDHLALTGFFLSGLGLAPGGEPGDSEFHLIPPHKPGNPFWGHAVAVRAD